MPMPSQNDTYLRDSTMEAGALWLIVEIKSFCISILSFDFSPLDFSLGALALAAPFFLPRDLSLRDALKSLY